MRSTYFVIDTNILSKTAYKLKICFAIPVKILDGPYPAAAHVEASYTV